ncbi:tetratricopeptide repeat protein [Neolewinella litorea]|uniref:Tetratricopeptide repeat protein n=1 Tax=Neolewinella litorea TaxID=2562452 RepID=A0A4S4NLP1_9BACT|nr:tetratricopeptide repeat protein [Neolewinella litorea]THH40712.1 tetratricopeptide repeat protein [Neolewinella litorea]
MQRTTLLLLAILLGLTPLVAQSDAPPGTVYYQVTKLKDPTGNLMQVENTLMLPYFQARVNDGSQIWHALYRIVSPDANEAGYDYISVDVYDNLSELHLPESGENQVIEQTFPHTTPDQFWGLVEEDSDVISETTYTIAGALMPAPSTRGEPSAPLLAVNYMLVPPGKESDYLAMETEVFKPIMEQHVKQGSMENWSLFERAIPVGTDFGANFATVDAFSDWDQVEAYQQKWQSTATATHPNKDLGAIMNQMTDLRERTRMEVWELQRETTPPSSESISYQIIQEGTGPKPLRGQEVTWSGKVMNERGETVFETSSLGEDWQDILGSDPTNTRWNNAVKMVGAGGIVQVTVPASRQSFREQQRNGGGHLIMKINVKEIGPPVKYGHDKLKEILTSEGLEAAQEWYAGLKRSNPNGYVFREMQMNALGYDLMAEGYDEEAIYVLDLNRQQYPDSFNVYDSLADAYSNAGNDFHAKEHFKMALKKNPDSTFTAEKLGKLK